MTTPPPGYGWVKAANRWDVLVPEHRAAWDGWTGWELARFDSMHRNIRPGDVVFDVGAWTSSVGEFAVTANLTLPTT